MTSLFKKLNYKNQSIIVAIDSPKSFQKELESMSEIAIIKKDMKNVKEIEFVIGFVTKQDELDKFFADTSKRLKGDAVVWLCYPKMSSKNYKCDFNRDTGWENIGQYQLEPVRQVSIDDDFSALRFRRVDFIKKITRRESMALTTEAKKRTLQKGK
jgi:hypothetical protein